MTVQLIQVDNTFSNVSPQIRPYQYGTTIRLNRQYVRAFGLGKNLDTGEILDDNRIFEIATLYKALLTELSRYGILIPDYQIVISETFPNQSYSRDIIQIFAREVCGPNLEVILQNPQHQLFLEAARSWIQTCESLVKYYRDSLNERKPHLYDIARPCQYIFSNTRSILVDLDPRPNEPDPFFKSAYLTELFGVERTLKCIIKHLQDRNDIERVYHVISSVEDLRTRAMNLAN